MSTDGENWTDTVAGDLPAGKTYFRVASDQTTPLKPNWTEGDSSDYDIGGNINSLVKTNFENDTTCYSFYRSNTGIFQGKSKLKSASKLVLPATTLVNSCYRNMFYGCTNLNYIKCLATSTSVTNCTKDWVSGVASTGTFVKNGTISSWETGVNGIPEGWTTQNA